MKIALYTTAIREPSFTHRQEPPADFAWVNRLRYDADAVLATPEVWNWLWAEHREAAHPKILWLQESRWLTDINLVIKTFLRDGVLVLSNQRDLCDQGAVYATLIGTWITTRDQRIEDKTKTLSMIASDKKAPQVAGYRVRKQIRDALGGDQFRDGFGGMFHRIIADKYDGLAPYLYSIVVESERYDWWITEKIGDALACKTVPIYWGCPDLAKFAELGFDPDGIIAIEKAEDIASLSLTRDRYDRMRPAIERNYERIWQLYCTEILLVDIFRQRLGLK